MKKVLKYLLYLIIVVGVLFIDLLTKSIIENSLNVGESYALIPKFLKFTYIHNTGAAFGILSGKTIYLVIFSILVVGFLLYQFYVYRYSNKISIILSVLLGGLFGNLYDRISFQYVRDFIDFTIFKYDAPIFNFSDICICISIFLLLLSIYKYEGVSKDVNTIDYERDGRQEVRSVSNRNVNKDEK